MPFRTGATHVMKFRPIGRGENLDERLPQGVDPYAMSDWGGAVGTQAAPHVAHIISLKARCRPIRAESPHGSISRTKADNVCSGRLFVMVEPHEVEAFKRLFEIKTFVFG